MATKTLDDIKADMSALYDSVLSGSTDLKTAAELANISGKYLKAEQLKLARDIFLEGKKPLQLEVGNEKPVAIARGAA